MNRVSQIHNTLNPLSSTTIKRDDELLEQAIEQIQQWWQSPRFHNVQRPYTAKQVAETRDTIQTTYYSNYMATKFYNLMTNLHRRGSYSLTYGALDPIQVTNMSKYLSSIYVSGWQCSSTASTTNEPGPDFADYPHNTVPNKCDQLVRMLRLQDRRQNYERAQMSAEEKSMKQKIDYQVPLICDADAGFGGVTSVMKLTKLFIEAGAAGIHIEDQRADLKKCGHMAGKVVTSTSTHIQKLVACRLQADLMGNELFLIARTDVLGAKFIESNIDPLDQPFIYGLTQGFRKPVTYPEAGILIIEQTIEQERSVEVINSWLRDCHQGGLAKAKELARSLGFELNFDWECLRNPDGFYSLQGTVKYCATRAKEYLKIADALWMETSSPDLAQAKELSDYLKYELQNNKFLSYNCSPSFNWSKFGFSDKELSTFNQELGKLGYTWQFITLAGFHLDALLSEKFSKDLSERNMLAYVETIQRKEEKNRVDQLRHQRWSGADLIDSLTTMVNQAALISQGEESTEHQFNK